MTDLENNENFSFIRLGSLKYDKRQTFCFLSSQFRWTDLLDLFVSTTDT